jgi:hypothetical protein
MKKAVLSSTPAVPVQFRALERPRAGGAAKPAPVPHSGTV